MLTNPSFQSVPDEVQQCSAMLSPLKLLSHAVRFVLSVSSSLTASQEAKHAVGVQ